MTVPDSDRKSDRLWLEDRATLNLIANGDFADFESALPDGWSEHNAGTVSK